MIRVNLLPSEIHAAQVRKQLQVGGIALGGLVVLILLGFWGTRVVKAKNLEKQLAQANEELRKYQAIVDKVNELEQTRNQLKARRDVIQQLLSGTLRYPKFFEDFMAVLPGDIWVSNVSTSLDPQGVMSVSVSATSLSNFAIADWLTSLQDSPLFSDVKLGTLSSSETNDGSVVSFTMSFKYQKKEI